MARKVRLLDVSCPEKIVLIRHLGVEPYNEVVFEDNSKIIVSYSLNYWEGVFKNSKLFFRVNKGLIINTLKVKNIEKKQIFLSNNETVEFSRRKLKAWKQLKTLPLPSYQ